MQKLFETNINQSMEDLPMIVDADVFFTAVPYIMFELFQLDNNFKTYVEGTVQPSTCLERELSQHPIKNCSSSYAVLNLEWWILKAQIKKSFLLSR